jgi:hypothetical protein
MKTMYINLVICFFPLTSLLAIENLQNHFIFQYSIFSFGKDFKNSRKVNIDEFLVDFFISQSDNDI